MKGCLAGQILGPDTVFEGLCSDTDHDAGLDIVFDSDHGSGSESFVF
jgi:hypothetical protein